MLKKTLFTLALIGTTALTGGAQDARGVVAAASKAMGADQLKTIQLSGSGMEYAFGQAYNPSSPWPGWRMKSETRTFDFDAPAMRIERVVDAPEPNRKGGGLQPGAMQQLIVNANTPWPNQLPIWLTPYGFLREAAKNDVTLSSKTMGGKKYSVVTFMAPNKAKVNGYIGADNMVARVETWIDNPMLGDTPYNETYSDYKDFGGVKVPTHIVERQGDYPTLDLMVSDAKANVAANIAAPQRGGGAPAGGGGPQGPSSQKLGDGVFLIMPAYAAIAVDMKDGVVVLEGPQSTMRGEQIIAEVHKDIPGKSIKYVFNTHNHFDHSSGLRAFVAEGATIITSQTNKGYYEKIFALPHTLNPDKAQQAGKKPVVEGVGEKKVLTDGTHVVELYHMQNFGHHDGMLIVYLPKEKVLLEADGYNPQAATATPPSPASPYTASLFDNIQRLKLDVQRIVPVHYPADNRPIAMTELARWAGRTPSTR